MEKERESNFELLRIISTIMIILFHCAYKSGFEFDGELRINEFFVKSLWMLGELGVNLFILTSGYFMISSKFRIQKVLLLIFEVMFYRLFSLLAEWIVFDTPVSIYRLALPLVPFVIGPYWFATVYIIMYILTPYLNLFIKSMSRGLHGKFLITLILIWSAIPTVFGVIYDSTEGMEYYNRMIWILVMYFIGSYIRLYPLKFLNSGKKAWGMSMVAFSTIILTIPVINIMERYIKISDVFFWTPNNVLMLILSVSVFVAFSKTSITSNKIVNLLGSASFGIYLFHDGSLNHYIWGLFNNASHLNSHWLIFRIMFSVVCIYIVGLIVEIIRQVIEKYTVKKVISKGWEK